MPDKSWQALLQESTKTGPRKEHPGSGTEWQSLIRSSWIGHTDWSPGSLGRASIHRKVEDDLVRRQQEAIEKERARQEFLIDKEPNQTTWKDFLRPDPNASVFQTGAASPSEFFNRWTEEIYQEGTKTQNLWYHWSHNLINGVPNPINSSVERDFQKEYPGSYSAQKALTNLVAGPVSLAGLGASIIERPQETGTILDEAGKGLVDSINPFKAGLQPHERFEYSLNLIFALEGAGLAAKSAGRLKANWTTTRMLRESGFTKVQARSVVKNLREGAILIQKETGKKFEPWPGYFESRKFRADTQEFLALTKRTASTPPATAPAVRPATVGQPQLFEEPVQVSRPAEEAAPKMAPKAPKVQQGQPSLFDEGFEYAPEDVLPNMRDRGSANRVYAPSPEGIDAARIEGVPDQTPLEILQDFVENTKTKSPRQSRRVGKTKAGYFDPRTAQIVLKNRGDMNSFWHEVGHHMTYLFPDLVNKITPETLAELVSLHSDVLGKMSDTLVRKEAIGEFVRAYVLNPAEAARRAPEFAKTFSEIVPEDLISQLDIASRKIHRFITKTPSEKIGSTIQFIDEIKERPSVIDQARTAVEERSSAKTAGAEEYRTSTGGKARQKVTDYYAPLDEAIEFVLDRSNRAESLPEGDAALLHDRLPYVDNAIREQLAGGLMDENFNPIAATQRGGQRIVVAETPEGYVGLVENDGYFYEDGMVKKGRHYVDEDAVPPTLDRDTPLSPEIANVAEEAFAAREFMGDTGTLSISEGISPENLGNHHVQGLSLKWVLQPIIDMSHYRESIVRAVAERVDEIALREYDQAGGMFGEKVDLEAFAKDVEKAGIEFFDAAPMDSYAHLKQTINQLENAAGGKAFKERVKGYREIFDSVEKDIRGRTQKIINSGYGIDRADELAYKLADMADDFLQGQGLGMDEVARLSRASDFAARYRTFSNAILDRAERAGLIDSATKADILAGNKYYVDLGRVMDDALVQYGVESPGIDSFKNQTKRVKGSTREIMDPVYNLVENAVVTLKLAELNEARNAFFDHFRDVDGLDIDTRSALATVAEKISTGDGGRQVIKVWKEGVKENWLIRDEALYKALKGKTPLSQNVVTKATTLMKGYITNWLPFLIKNWIRDAGDAAIIANNESGLGQVFFAGEARSAKWFGKLLATPDAELSGHYTLGGAGMAIWSDIDSARSYEYLVREAVGQVIDENLKSPHDFILSPVDSPRLIAKRGRTGIKVIDTVFHNWDKLKNAAERSPRIAQYELAYNKRLNEFKTQGLDDAKAKRNAILKASEDVRGIIDFARGGDWSRNINAYVPFFNAQIQGVTSAFNSLFYDLQGIKSPGGKARVIKRTASLAVKFALVETAIYQWNQMNGMTQDDYDALPDYQKDFFYNLKLPNFGYLRIPKPYSTAILQTFGANALTGQLDGDRWAGLGADMATSLTPMTKADDALPGIVAPAIEVSTNHDFFKGSDIVPSWEKGKPLEYRDQSKASLFARTLTGIQDDPSTEGYTERGFGLPVDARIVDHLLNSYFGSPYKMLTGSTDLVENKNYPEKLPRLGNALVGITTAETVGADPDVRRAYEIAKQNGITGVMKSKMEKLDKIRSRPTDLGNYSRLYSEMKDAKLDIIRTARELNKALQERVKPDMTPRQKRDAIRRVFSSFK